jgi:PST family polysaccharide transporter
MSDLRQKAVRGAAWSTIENWAGQGMSFLVFLILARILGPEDFGLVALASVYVLVVQTLIRQGFAEAILQVRDLEDEHLDAAFWTNLVVSLLFGVFTVIAAPLVARLLGSEGLTQIIRCLSLLFPLGAFSAVQQALLNRRLEFKALAYRTFASFGCSGLVGITMALLHWGVWSLVGQQLAYATVNVVVLWTAGGWRPKFRFSVAHLRQLWKFGVHISSMNLLDLVNKRADQYLVGQYLGMVMLGYYSVAVRIYGLMLSMGVSSLTRVAAGAFPRLQHQPERLVETLGKTVELTTCVAFPAYLGFAAMAPEIVSVFFGPHWMPAVPAAQLLMLVGALDSVQLFHGQLLRSIGRPGLQFMLLVMNIIVNLACYVVFVRYGLEAMVFAFVVRAYALFPVELVVLKRVIPLKIWPYLRRLLPQAICSVAMLALIYAVKSLVHGRAPNAVVLALGVLAGAAFYAGAMSVWRPDLRRQLIDFVAKFRRRRASFAAAAAAT